MYLIVINVESIISAPSAKAEETNTTNGDSDGPLKLEITLLSDEPSSRSTRSTTLNYGVIEDSIQLCESHQRNLYPTSGLTTSGNGWHTPNTNDKMKQSVRVNECVDRGAACENVASFPNGYRCECQQMFMDIPLFYIMPNGTMYRIDLNLPTHCLPVVINVESSK